MLPNFFVIGAAKCGTTSLALYLGLHPEVHISPVNEPRFFAEPDPLRPFPGRRVGDLSEYESLFDSSSPLRGEVCGSYSQHPWRPGVPQRIHELVPEARFVYVVGDPIKRIESHYMQTVAEEGEARSLNAAIGDIEDPQNPAVCPGRYAYQAEQYLAMFPEDRMLVVDRNDLQSKRLQTLSSIFSFLGVAADYHDPEFGQMHNRSSDHRRLSSGLYGRLRQSSMRTAVRALPPTIRKSLLEPVRRALTDEVPRPLLDDGVRARLEGYFRPEVERLRLLTGKSFDGWSV